MYFLVGIKGSGMASLALILKDREEQVAGSDIDTFIFTQVQLEASQIPIYHFDEKNIKDGMIVIVGSAFDDSHPEVQAAKRNESVKVYTYAEFLGTLVDQYHSICVSGTHGKTTTTGLLSHVFETIQPTGYLIGDGSGKMPVDAKTFVLESCEYQRRFLAYRPDYAIILNVELDHVDYYKSEADYLLAFEQFSRQVKKGIAIFGDEQNTRALQIQTNHLYYGLHNDNDVQAYDIDESEQGVSFKVKYKNKYYYTFTLPFYGVHMLYNALGVIAIGIMNDIAPSVLQGSLATFRGVHRRFNIEEQGGNVFIDDYAHHPTAIELTIQAAKQKYPLLPLVAIFQPDRYSRIEYFLDSFATAFDQADAVFICPFPANAKREPGITITNEGFVEAVKNAQFCAMDDACLSQLKQFEHAVYLFMSSKDIYKLKDRFVHFLNR